MDPPEKSETGDLSAPTAGTPIGIEVRSSDDVEDGLQCGVLIRDTATREQVPVWTSSVVSPTWVDPETVKFPVDVAFELDSRELSIPVGRSVVVHRDGAQIAVVEEIGQTSFGPGTYVLDVHGPMKLYLEVTGGLEISRSATGIDVDIYENERPLGGVSGDVSASARTTGVSDDVLLAGTDHGHSGVAGSSTVTVGVRSYHDRPAGTITVPPSPTGAMAGLSALGSAIKSHSPERSWPTLRGHPPLFEVGDELSIPDTVSVPDVGITIEGPTEWSFVYPATPLTYYLGARLKPGPKPRLRVTAPGEDPLVYALDEGRADDAPAELTRVLQRVFTLDCVVRNAGIYNVPMRARRKLTGPEGPLSESGVERLYRASEATRLREYLSIPYEVVEPYVPEWPATAWVDPSPASLETLPFLIRDLAAVRTSEEVSTADAPSSVAGGSTQTGRGRGRRDGLAVDDDTSTSVPALPTPGGAPRSAAGGRNRTRRGNDEEGSGNETPESVDLSGAGTRPPDTEVKGRESSTTVAAGQAGDAGSQSGSLERVSLPETDARERIWVGGGVPVNGTKAVPEGFEHGLVADQSETVDIEVVCNDPAMEHELRETDSIYGEGDEDKQLPFSVSATIGATTAELRSILARDTDFLHYIGHVTDDGLSCSDGSLDVRTVDRVGVDGFLLNGCASYDQGLAMVERGAVAGVVTLEDVVEVEARRMGSKLTRLLNAGYPVQAALSVTKRSQPGNPDYTVVGDGSHVMVNGGTQPRLLTLREGDPGEVGPEELSSAGVMGVDGDESPTEDETYVLRQRTFPTRSHGLGSTYFPRIGGIDEHFLTGTQTSALTVDRDDLLEFLSIPARVPVFIESTPHVPESLHWKHDIAGQALVQMLSVRSRR
jgi:hypothetical protein